MPVRFVCFQCDFVVERAEGAAMPSRCPSCGTLLTCPHCGETLHRASTETTQLHCTRCNIDLSGEETKPFEPQTVNTPAASALMLPGFEILEKLGQGGMGIVYRARQLNPAREVAIKMLPPALAADPDMLQRFGNEAAVAAKLVDSHLVPVFQVIESGGVPVIVMPFIAGHDLGRILTQRRRLRAAEKVADPHPLAVLDERKYIEAILPLFDRVVDATAALQRAGVLHRDIKPSNILVDLKNNCWLSDFGLARFQDAENGTRVGTALGTRQYASPEQAHGDRVDGRTDVFGLAATLYHALTCELPYGKNGAADTTRAPQPLSKLLRGLPRAGDFNAVLQKALEREPSKRYRDADDFREDWQRVRSDRLPRASAPGTVRRLVRWATGHVWQIAAGFAIAAAVCLGILAPWLRHAKDHHPSPADEATRNVRVATKPAGAHVVLVQIDPETGQLSETHVLRPRGRTPLTVAGVPVGQYLVVTDLPGQGFHEVYRVVPGRGQLPGAYRHNSWKESTDGTVDLGDIVVPTNNVVVGMASFDGGRFTMGPDDAIAAHQETVAPFFLDCTEVPLAAFLKVCQGMANELVDHPLPSDNCAACWVTFDQAVAYAEKIGKRLPDEVEYEFAATNGGATHFPWGDDNAKLTGWSFGPVGTPAFDHTRTIPPVFGLYSNVAEWTSSRFNPNIGRPGPRVPRDMAALFLTTMVVRGGPYCVIEGRPQRGTGSAWEWLPSHRQGISGENRYRGLGFRCARSRNPRFLVER